MLSSERLVNYFAILTRQADSRHLNLQFCTLFSFSMKMSLDSNVHETIGMYVCMYVCTYLVDELQDVVLI